jgi:hypothetical protein
VVRRYFCSMMEAAVGAGGISPGFDALGCAGMDTVDADNEVVEEAGNPDPGFAGTLGTCGALTFSKMVPPDDGDARLITHRLKIAGV